MYTGNDETDGVTTSLHLLSHWNSSLVARWYRITCPFHSNGKF